MSDQNPIPPARLCVELIDSEIVFQGFFRLSRYRLKHEGQREGWIGPMDREVFERGRAAAVLPYDVARDRVVLIRQFRAGAYAAGRRDPWLIEIVAGIVDAGEDDAAMMRREAREEAGITLGKVIPCLDFLTSPGGCDESIGLAIAACDSTGAGGLHGLAEEHEDIEVFAIALDEALAMADSGRIDNAITLLALYYLDRHKSRLRAQLIES